MLVAIMISASELDASEAWLIRAIKRRDMLRRRRKLATLLIGRHVRAWWGQVKKQKAQRFSATPPEARKFATPKQIQERIQLASARRSFRALRIDAEQ